jgi:hypothetical protein
MLKLSAHYVLRITPQHNKRTSNYPKHPLSGHVRSVVENVARMQVFSQVLQFPLSILILQNTSYTLIILSPMMYNLDTDSIIKLQKAGKLTQQFTEEEIGLPSGPI